MLETLSKAILVS